MPNSRIQSGLLLGLMLAVVGFALAGSGPPAVVPDTALKSDFSAERADAHLFEITRAPHPLGSDEHARVTRYLADALTNLQLEMQIQETTIVRGEEGWIKAAVVRNVIGRKRGTDSHGALLLMAHYDAVPFSHGASDDGAGVSAILETVRALNAGAPLKNDLVVLLSDGEEIALLGAAAFVEQFPWAQDVRMVLDFEGRGHRGAAIMFRTLGTQNGPLIDALAQVPGTVANSLSNAVFKLLPNDTDLSVFDRPGSGFHGMDFAFVEGLTHYHRPIDTYANQDPRSLQHHGTYLLALARHFGNADLATLDGPEQIYFNLPQLGLVHYPNTWALPLAFLNLLLLIAFVVAAVKRGQLHGAALTAGLGSFAMALIVVPALTFGASLLVEPALPETGWMWPGVHYQSGLLLAAYCAFAIALALAISLRIGRHASALERLLPALVLWCVLNLVSAVLLPGGSYVLQWPLLATIIGAALVVFERPKSELARQWLPVLFAVPALLIVPLLIDALATAMTLKLVAVYAVLMMLLLGLLAVPIDAVLRGLRGQAPALFVVIGVGFALAAGLRSGFDAAQKKPNSVSYFADLDQGSAFWYSNDPAADPWTEQYLGVSPERGDVPARDPGTRPLRAKAPTLALETPSIEVRTAGTTATGTHYSLRLRNPPNSFVTRIDLHEGVAGNLSINGHPMPAGSPAEFTAGRLLSVYGHEADGFQITLDAIGTAPLRLRLRSQQLGLPDWPDHAIRPRAAAMMNGGDMTLLQRIVELKSESLAAP